MTVYPWPPELRAVGIAFDLTGQAASGPVSLVGNSQVVSLDGGLWMATLGDIAVVDRAAMLSFRRFRAVLQGGANQALVPVCDSAPWPGSARIAVATWSDTATWSDGAKWSQGVISVTLTAPAAARSTRLEVSYDAIGTIVGGEYFSIGRHLYQIAQVLAEASSDSPTPDAIWQIVPPLREDVGTDAYLNFDHPVCMMRPVREAEMDMMTWRNRTGVFSPTFIETFEAA